MPPVFSVATLLLSEYEPEQMQHPMEAYCNWYQNLLRVSNRTSEYYHIRCVPKRTGGVRTLKIPYFELERWQRVICDQVLPLYPISDCAFAYRKGLSVKDNAEPHLGKNYVVKIDLKDFFDHLTFGRVYGALKQNGQYGKAFLTMITNLCCVDGRLPQGACTSPALSNICFFRIDEKITQYCEVHGLTYTRYCDDLTISGDKMNPYQVIYDISRLLRGYGFKLNEEKISVRHRGQRMSVTGITIHERLRVSKDYRRKIRQEMYYVQKFGVREHLLHTRDPEFLINGKCRVKKYLRSLFGRIQYVLFVDPQDQEMVEYLRLVNAWLGGKFP
jgi:retron-type reverse transcriptase